MPTFDDFVVDVVINGMGQWHIDDLCGTATINKGGSKPMNKFIEENVKLTKDAILINKYFGSDLNSKVVQLLFKNKIDVLIKEAKRLEKESE